MKPLDLRVHHDPMLGPCFCADCRHERTFIRGQLIMIALLTAGATVAWFLAGWPWK